MYELKGCEAELYLKEELVREGVAESVYTVTAEQIAEWLAGAYLSKAQHKNTNISYTVIYRAPDFSSYPLYGAIYTTSGSTVTEHMMIPEEKTEPIGEWYIESGPLGMGLMNRKKVREVDIRLKKERDSVCRVQVRLDDSGAWETYEAVKGETMTVIRARLSPSDNAECFFVKISGTGDAEIYSMRIIYEDGGDGVY